MTLALVALGVAVLAYGASTLLLSTGAQTRIGSPYRSPAWLAGTGFQGVGFLATLVSRHWLPLLVVQPAVTSSVAVTAVGGMVLGRWRLRWEHAVALVAVVGGLLMVSAAAVPGPADAPPAVALVACMAAMVLAWVIEASARRSGPAAVQGAAAGLAFGVAAVAARAVAADPLEVLATPTGLVGLALLVAATVEGQVLLTHALAGGRVTGPISALYLVSTVAPILAGVLWLGDRLRPSAWPLAVAGVAATLGGCVVLARLEGQGPEPGESS